MDADLQDEIRQFVLNRVDAIRNGDREAIDATYSPLALSMRNEYNRHDYEWYLNLIEYGFGVEVLRIDIEAVNESPLPFDTMVSYWGRPDFKVFVQTVSGRRTLWLVENKKDGPHVVLPAFNGRVADQVATGEWQLHWPADNNPSRATIVEFHPDHFTSSVFESLSLILPTWSLRLKFDTIRALALDCNPEYGQCWLAILTTQESFPEEKYGKWATGNWRWCETSELNVEVLDLLQRYYRGETITDTNRTHEEREETIYRCLAKALLSPELKENIQRFTLADDFELAVINPDDPGRGNYCELVE